MIGCLFCDLVSAWEVIIEVLTELAILSVANHVVNRVAYNQELLVVKQVENSYSSKGLASAKPLLIVSGAGVSVKFNPWSLRSINAKIIPSYASEIFQTLSQSE